MVHDYVLTESELKGINELLAGSGDVVVGSDPTAQPKPSPQPLGLSVDQLNAIANFFNDSRLPKTLAVSRPSSLVRLQTTTAMVSWV
ncbi:MAG: hypothetical protein HZT40_18385 [Candidatus Thiothrix singaporensis]|uniref:Uncharacterized protein n=1 Tax=Candidatus Thiothrix singaporensis TaxID=2799669 RepID=A0A7L6AVN7_9GAMM|nr:MAG: hypothetical protein HZT40_18385 [Candidatus Thiothrix singaporensis]